ncbi:MAG: glycoside hydrolase family 127 protein [Clostridia bacterium]|nr:glycoside hydrolase family 127 protein [Clostridia bacterium]
MRDRLLPMNRVRVLDEFWSARQRLMTDVTIPYMEKILRDEVPGAEKSHAVSNFRMAAGEEQGEFYGMVFQDSDVAKWLEAAAYSLYLKPDPALEKRVDDMVTLIARAQQEDGYLNTYFTVKEPENRWANLLECHELYCAGHLLEAAAAMAQVAGKKELLRVGIRLADHIVECFRDREGIPGHQEIEIGLERMYEVTGNREYLDMAIRFLDRRGQDPDWFMKNTPAHPGRHYGGYDIPPEDHEYNQTDVPVREQTRARGHAVRQLYMLTAMARAADETGDESMRAACVRMAEHIRRKQIYVTGAVGSTGRHEAFTVDMDLPADRCYGETCASVAMTFFASRMLTLDDDPEYGDLMELELYNAALAGMQLDGTRFFYVNPLSVDPEISGKVPGYEHVLPLRPEWYACACCPPNLARLISSLGGYLWSVNGQRVSAHLWIGSEADLPQAKIVTESGYPRQAYLRFTVREVRQKRFTLRARVPKRVGNIQTSMNGETVSLPVKNGYLELERDWEPGDTLEITGDMLITRLYPDPGVRDCAGKVAIARGPVIYCAEGVDNGDGLSALILPDDGAITELPYDPNLLNGVIPLEAEGFREKPGGELYGNDIPDKEKTNIRLIPYYAWANRGLNEMTVWLRRG